MTDIRQQLRVRRLGPMEYEHAWTAMQSFTLGRDEQTPDELWLLEHPPVFTLGLNGKPEHLLDPGTIPVIKTDRGGQVTYHGPGQLVAYTLIDLERRAMGVQELVRSLEGVVIALLADQGLEAEGRRDAPGVYVNDAKIASLGLRVKKGRSYHGLALNLDMDLEPFDRINPCGYPGMAVTQLRALGSPLDAEQAGTALVHHLRQKLGYTELLAGPDQLPVRHDETGTA